MKVILKEDIKNIGKIFDVVEVKDGFARNYLIPSKLAVIATSEALKSIEADKAKKELLKEKAKMDAAALSEKISSISCAIQASCGNEEKLFGSVTEADIAESLRSEGIEVDKRQIELDEPIKKLGVYQVKIKLHPDITASLKLWVVRS